MNRLPNVLLRKKIVVSIFTALLSTASPASEQYPELAMQGDIYPNVCKPEEREVFFDVILKSGTTNAEEARRAISTILCSVSDVSSRSYISGLIPKVVRRRSISTGDKEVVKKVAGNAELIEELMAKGRAWNVGLRTESRRISLQYFVNEACVREVILSFADRKWFVSEIGEACD